MIEALILVVFPFCMVFAVISDIVSMSIANRVSLILAATFAIVAPLTGMDWSTFGMHFVAGFAVLAATFSLFALGTMGGGDAKLLATTSIWMGLSPELLQYLVYSAIFGGILTLLILKFRNSALSIFTGSNLFLRNFADNDAGIPYGVALGLSGLLVYPSTPVMQWALERLTAL